MEVLLNDINSALYTAAAGVNDFVDTLGGNDIFIYLALKVASTDTVYLAGLGTTMTIVLE